MEFHHPFRRHRRDHDLSHAIEPVTSQSIGTVPLSSTPPFGRSGAVRAPGSWKNTCRPPLSRGIAACQVCVGDLNNVSHINPAGTKKSSKRARGLCEKSSWKQLSVQEWHKNISGAQNDEWYAAPPLSLLIGWDCGLGALHAGQGCGMPAPRWQCLSPPARDSSRCAAAALRTSLSGTRTPPVPPGTAHS